ncbi:MAG: hypothetical protein K0Q79_1404 [Flavipsychrobacter sp.]|jgi:hypothetical protein|nr:hypothetical protein [Flavipsychrobacter sp.]
MGTVFCRAGMHSGSTFFILTINFTAEMSKLVLITFVLIVTLSCTVNRQCYDDCSFCKNAIKKFKPVLDSLYRQQFRIKKWHLTKCTNHDSFFIVMTAPKGMNHGTQIGIRVDTNYNLISTVTKLGEFY